MTKILRRMLICVAIAQLLGWCLAFPQVPDRLPPLRPAAIPSAPQDRQIIRSVVNESPEELIARIPELKEISFAASQEDLVPLLQKIGKNVEALFKDFPNTASTEEVRQRCSSDVLRTREETNRRFLYLISIEENDSQLRVEEYRSDARGKPLDLSNERRSFMLTSGYVSGSLVFHSSQQEGSTFRLLGYQQKKPDFILVAFAQQPGVAKLVGTIEASGVSAILLLQGVAWIDPETHRIARLWTEMLSPPANLGVKSHVTETSFQEVRFENITHPFWLPLQVEVTVQWGGYTYANRHRYSDYKVFSVDAQDGDKKLAKP